MKSPNELTLETLLISGLNITAIYVAAFMYKLNWTGVLTVMVLASLFTATITHLVLSKVMIKDSKTLNEGVSVLVVDLFSSLAILVILVQRFNFPEALGISFLTGLLSSLARHLLNM